MTEDGVQQKAMEGQKLWTITISTIEIHDTESCFTGCCLDRYLQQIDMGIYIVKQTFLCTELVM